MKNVNKIWMQVLHKEVLLDSNFVAELLCDEQYKLFFAVVNIYRILMKIKVFGIQRFKTLKNFDEKLKISMNQQLQNQNMKNFNFNLIKDN